jgi:SAM-dependent methyltransferase
MKDPSAIYDAPWFQQFPGLRDEFRAFGSALFSVFHPRSVVDIGCGPGMALERLLELGSAVHGIEGSAHAWTVMPEAVKPYVEHRDITRGGSTVSAVVVICTEVAEHLDAAHANTLVEMIDGACGPGGFVFFTAAPPGQGGHDHVNEQPMPYWLSRFGKRSLFVQPILRELVLGAMVHERPRHLWAQNWLFENSRVLSRGA